MAQPPRPPLPGDHAYVPAPRTLPGFPGAVRTEPKGARRRWIDAAGTLYEWDYLHGAVEVYTSRGRHLGEFDHRTGRRLKPPDPGRRIDP